MNRQAFEARLAALSEVTGVPAGVLLQAPMLVIAALEQSIRERDRAQEILLVKHGEVVTEVQLPIGWTIDPLVSP